MPDVERMVQELANNLNRNVSEPDSRNDQDSNKVAMRCPNCGNQFKEDINFCSNCGASIRGKAEISAPELSNAIKQELTESDRKKIRHSHKSAVALGFLWTLLGGGLLVYIGYLTLFVEFPPALAVFFGALLLFSLGLGIYFIWAGRKIAKWEEDLPRAQKINKVLLIVCYLVLAISLGGLAFGGGAGLGILFLGILTFYVHRAKNVFKRINV